MGQAKQGSGCRNGVPGGRASGNHFKAGANDHFKWLVQITVQESPRSFFKLCNKIVAAVCRRH